jgi:hypothetical protein
MTPSIYPFLVSFYLINQSQGKTGAFSTITVGAFSLDIYKQEAKRREEQPALFEF